MPAPSLAQMPPGACDCHTHVIGDEARFPMVPERQYTPRPAPVEALAAHLDALQLQRVVVVQPSVYGTDHRVLLEALARLDGRGRGIAVPAHDADRAALRSLHAQGVRGIRINLESDAVRDAARLQQALQREATRIADAGWHLQLYASPDVVARQAGLLASLPVPVVLDHFAMLPLRTPQDADIGNTLLSLLRTGNVYLKLSAPYRLGPAALPGEEASALAARTAALLRAAPRQLLWGSDWPHTARDPGKGPLERSQYRTVGPAALAGGIAAWLPTPAARQSVLVDNPARLYGF